MAACWSICGPLTTRRFSMVPLREMVAGKNHGALGVGGHGDGGIDRYALVDEEAFDDHS